MVAAGLPAAAAAAEDATADPLGLLDTSGMTPQEVIGLDPALDDPKANAESGDWHPDRPALDEVEQVPVTDVAVKPRSELVDVEPATSPRWGDPVVWPEPGRSSVTVPEHAGDERGGPPGRGARAGALPIWIAAVDPADADALGAGRSVPDGADMVVEVLDRDTARDHGATVAIQVSSDDATASLKDASAAAVTVDYTGFDHAFGGDYGSRLTAKVFDADCVATGGQCHGTPVESVNDPAAGTLTATVPVEGGDGSIIMLTSGEGGAAGDWAATSLSPSGEWSHGGSSGDFSWSYPMRSPDMPGGLGPDLSLGYSSGSVDGRTTSTNNQTSWIGEGWSGLEPGFVERRYMSCAEDMGSGANNSVKTGDLCWKQENAILSLGGTTTELVKDSGTGVWRPKNDDGSRVERLTGANNGARNGEYWRVTTTDGVQYYFGKHTRYAGDTAATNSVLTVPIAGNHAGEPCHASAFADSFCDQAYRWNLDYVVDPNGNTMTYFYTQESNRYGQNLNDESVSYHRGSYLRRVEYGQRKGTEHSTVAPARVVFTTSERCLTDCAALTEATAENWPDVPYDLICTSSSSCADRYSPSFFSRKRLTQVETQVRVSGSYQAVDRWTFEQDFPDPGDDTSAALWLESVQHSGRAGTAITLPKVTFDGQQMPNRVDGLEGAPPLIKYRIRSISSETGAVVAVNYLTTECAPATVPTPHTNTKRCFPVYWNFEGSGETDPQVHWFHKYVVDSIIETDGTGDGLDVENHYTYGGSPAWAHNDDPFTDEDYWTWGEWRGYGKVTTRVGHPDTDQLRTDALYFRGLDGDRATPSGGTKSVSVTDSWGDSVTDRDEWAGMLRESIVYDGSSKVSSTINDPWRSSVTADDGDNQARLVNVAATREHTSLAAGGWRTTESQFSYDSHGLVTQVNDRGDISTTSDDLCTRTEYAKNTSKWILETVKRSETVSKRCSVIPTRPGDVVADGRFSYDSGAYGASPLKGNVTRTEVLDSWSGGPQYVTTGQMAYDVHGRATSVWDALDRQTTTVFTPATGGPVTETVVTNPAGHATTTTMDPLVGQPTRVIDANGRVTDASYDALGRVTKVWLTDRDKATESASVEYTYRVSKTAPVAVTSKSLLPDESYASSVQLYDSLLRPRQSQTPAVDDSGGRMIILSGYDSRGLVVEVKGPFFATGSPSTVLVEPTESVPRTVATTFDGASRVTEEVLFVHQDEHSRRATAYGGDRVSLTPPDGGTATTTITDARGRTVELREYHAATPAGSYDATTYGYTPAGELANVLDPAGNEWSYSYDLRGRRVGVDDPDAGTSSTVYDVASQVVSATDGRGETLFYGYDVLGRKTETRAGSPADEVVAAWVFDTLELGQLTSSTSYVDGQAYTTSVYGYDDAYRSLGEKVTIPAAEGVLAGEFASYHTYYPDGSPYITTEPGVAGLPQETLRSYYDPAGVADRMSSGNAVYVAGTNYTPFGEVAQYSLGAWIGLENWQTFAYEEGTRRLSHVRVDRAGIDPADSEITYSYDPAGNPVSIADAGGLAGVGDVQCYTYDHLRRVTGAWAQTTSTCASDPETASLGGPAPYGQSYSYDLSGNRTELVEYDPAGGPGIVTMYTYPEPGQDGPHSLLGMSSIGPAGTSTTSFAYDDVGNTLTVDSDDDTDDATYAWDEHGRMASADTNDGSSEFIYGADGNRLLRKTQDATTLYVFGTELTLDHTSGTVTGERYYTFNGTVLAMREGADDLYAMGVDLWGTPTTMIHNTSNENTIRRQDPYGNPRGTGPSAWPGDRGFHTGTNDDATGLVHMGARQYDPAIGRFLSVDPLIEVTDSQQMHGYAYANNNPLAFSDPTGLIIDGGASGVYSVPKANGQGETVYQPGKKPIVLTSPPKPPTMTDQLRDQVSGSDTGVSERDDPATLDQMSKAYFEQAYVSLEWYQQDDMLFRTWCYNNPAACSDLSLSWSDIPEIGAAAYGWALDNRGTIATLGATGVCVVPGAGWAACAGAQGAAFGVRAQQRASEGGGYAATARDSAGDALLTAVFTGLVRGPMMSVKYTGSGTFVRNPAVQTEQWELLTAWQKAAVAGGTSLPMTTKSGACVIVEPKPGIC